MRRDEVDALLDGPPLGLLVDVVEDEVARTLDPFDARLAGPVLDRARVGDGIGVRGQDEGRTVQPLSGTGRLPDEAGELDELEGRLDIIYRLKKK